MHGKGNDMEYKEFEERIGRAAAEMAGTEYGVEINSILRTNGRRRPALRIWKKGDRKHVAPVVYLDSLYETTAPDVSFRELAAQIFGRYEKMQGRKELQQITRDIQEWESVKGDVYPALLWAERNQELLKTLPHDRMLDLAVIYLIRSEDGMESSVSVKVTDSLLRGWGIPEAVLRETAFANQREDYRIYSMEEAGKMAETGKVQGEKPRMGTEKVLDPKTDYFLTNSYGAWGAAVMADGELMKELLGDRNYFIIPSSIHEVLLIPDNGLLDRKAVDEMIREVNRSSVAEEEWLGEHCYYYDGGQGAVIS